MGSSLSSIVCMEQNKWTWEDFVLMGAAAPLYTDYCKKMQFLHYKFVCALGEDDQEGLYPTWVAK